MGRYRLHRPWPARPSVRPPGRAADAPYACHRGATGQGRAHFRGAAMNSATLRRSGPRPNTHVPMGWLSALATLSIATWLVTEWVAHSPTHPRYAEMLS